MPPNATIACYRWGSVVSGWANWRVGRERQWEEPQKERHSIRNATGGEESIDKDENRGDKSYAILEVIWKQKGSVQCVAGSGL